MSESGTESRTIGAVETTLAILEEIRARNGAQVSELAEALDISKSSAHHHLSTLKKQNFVAKRDGMYHLGSYLLTYGGTARMNEEIFETNRRSVDRLASKTGETVRLVVENSGHGLTVYQGVGDKVDDPYTHVGMLEPLHSTAAGKAFLSALPLEEVETIVEGRDLTEVTSNTITVTDELFRKLREIRSRGVAFDEGEQFPDVRCVATTVESEEGELLGSISISAPADRMPDDRFYERLPDLLRDSAEPIKQIGEYQFRHRIPSISRTL